MGGTVAFGILNIKSGVTNLLTVDLDPNDLAPGVPQTLYQTAIDDTDTDVAFNVGIQWRPHPRLSFGAVYRGGMEFEVTETVFNDGFFVDPITGAGYLALLFNDPQAGNTLATTFNTPDSYGAGVSWRPVNPLTVSADWVHIKYSDLLDGFQGGLNVLTLFDPAANFTVDDADEFHVGAEYVFSAGTVPLAVRAGAFSDHNSRIFADFAGGGSSFSTNESFPERDTEIHYTLGTGVVVKERFQIDAAADFSGIANEYVLSTIFRF
jgi:long-subunit fatty acid transport protein